MLYRTAVRHLASHAPKHHAPSLCLPCTSHALGATTRVGGLSGSQCALIVTRRSLGFRFYATTRSTGTQTDRPKAKTAKAKTTKTKSTTSKEKTAAKKKKDAAKKKTAKPKKKAVLSESKQKALKVNALKKRALLDEPKYKPTTVWTLLSSEGAAGTVNKESMALRKSRYDNLSASERQTFQTSADANKRSNELLKRQFIERFTPYEIYMANLARNALSRIAKQPLPADRKHAFTHKKNFVPLNDPRVPKAPSGPYVQFFVEQQNTSGEGFGDRAKTAASQWKNLDRAERKRYEDIYAFQREEYVTKLRQLMPERYAKTTRRSRSAS